jgi:hypothetical protein
MCGRATAAPSGGETNAGRRRWFRMSADRDRLLKLLDQLETTLRELREAVSDGPSPESSSPESQRRPHEVVRAFADEAFRARDA